MENDFWWSPNIIFLFIVTDFLATVITAVSSISLNWVVTTDSTICCSLFSFIHTTLCVFVSFCIEDIQSPGLLGSTGSIVNAKILSLVFRSFFSYSSLYQCTVIVLGWTIVVKSQRIDWLFHSVRVLLWGPAWLSLLQCFPFPGDCMRRRPGLSGLSILSLLGFQSVRWFPPALFPCRVIIGFSWSSWPL